MREGAEEALTDRFLKGDGKAEGSERGRKEKISILNLDLCLFPVTHDTHNPQQY